MECIWSAEISFGSHPDHERSRPPSSTVLDVLSTVSARAGNISVRVSWYARFTKVRSNNLSTQLRRTRTSSTVSPPVATTVADPEQMADSEQIRVATIALHTQKKARNLQEAQVSQRRTLSFLAVSHLLLWADLHDGKSLSLMGLKRERWCCTRGLVSRLDMNTCQTSIKTDILL